MPRKGEKADPASIAKRVAVAKQLGPRMGHAPIGARRITAPTRTPKATGVPRGVAGSGPDGGNR